MKIKISDENSQSTNYMKNPILKVIKLATFSEVMILHFFSHEKKKMYWEQLELRCRSFYQQQGAPASTHGSVRGPPIPSSTYCSCCEECRYPSIPVGPQIYPWDTHHSTDR